MTPHPTATTNGAATAAPPSDLATHPVLSGVLAGLVLWGAAFFVLGEEAPRSVNPPFAAAAVFLSLGVFFDVRFRRLPNFLTFGTLLAALLFQAAAPASWGALGAGAAFAGVVAALLLVVPYAVGLLGAGDVKASMALGALIGAPSLLATLAWAALLGGVLGMGILLARSGFGPMLRRWHLSWLITQGTGRATYLAPEPHEAAAQGLPYAVTLGFGFVLHLALGAPWS